VVGRLLPSNKMPRDAPPLLLPENATTTPVERGGPLIAQYASGDYGASTRSTGTLGTL
jgi:hypothetical protein